MAWVQTFPLNYYIGNNNDWSLHCVQARRLKKANITSYSSVLDKNMITSNTKIIHIFESHQVQPIIYTPSRKALLAEYVFSVIRMIQEFTSRLMLIILGTKFSISHGIMQFSMIAYVKMY